MYMYNAMLSSKSSSNIKFFMNHTTRDCKGSSDASVIVHAKPQQP